MAQTSAFQIDSRKGGISDDVFVGIADSSYAIENLEIRKNPKSVKLQNTLVDEFSELTATGYFHCWVAVSDGKTLFFTTTWEIWINIAWTWTLAYTMVGNPAILWAAEYNGYVYFATATHLSRVLLATLASTFTPTDINWQAFTEQDTTNHPMVATNLYLYIGDGQYVATVQDTVFDATTLNVPSDENVYQLTDNGASIRVYTRKWVSDTGVTYYRDGVSDAVEQTQRLTGKMYNVCTKDDVDYITMGTMPILYFYPYQKQPLKRIDATLLSPYPNSMIVYENYVLMGREGWVWTRWAYTKDYPECLNYDYTSSVSSGWVTTCIINSSWTLYVAFYEAGEWTWIERLSTTDYVLSGSFMSRAFYWSSIWENKYGIEMRMTHAPLMDWENILVYAFADLDLLVPVASCLISWPTTDLVSEFKLNFNFKIANLSIAFWQSLDATHTPEIYNIYLKIEESQ